MESLIKTQIALDKSNLDVILIEEPENHLCYNNMQKILFEICKRQNNSQIIITTHNNLIASRLNLNNVIWVMGNKAKSLKSISKIVADFFVKADDNSFLQFLLSERVILVEGATEFLLMPYIYEKITNRTIESDKVSVISCNGISYKNYLEIANKSDKKIAVITDNDKKQSRINEAEEYNKNNLNQHIFMSKNVDNWTWEACLYNCNTELLESFIKLKDNSEYLFHGINYGKVLGKMLNNKVDTAYKLLTSKKDFVIPEYVKEAILWLNK